MMLDILRKHEFMLNRELHRLQQAYAVIHTYSSLIQEGLLAEEDKIYCQQMDVMPINIGPLNDYSSGYFYNSFFKFMEQLPDSKAIAAYPAGGLYINMDAFLNSPGQPARFFSVNPTGRHNKEAGEYLIGYSRGYYGNIGDLPERMITYAEENGYTFTGPVYELYLHDEISTARCEQYLIQVSAQVKKARISDTNIIKCTDTI
jgi:hypothetical protein